jgi:hypothetical protein
MTKLPTGFVRPVVCPLRPGLSRRQTRTPAKVGSHVVINIAPKNQLRYDWMPFLLAYAAQQSS